MNNLYDRLENLYGYFYKERGDMERSLDYRKLTKEVPEVGMYWEAYKKIIKYAREAFEDHFEELLKQYNKGENKK